MASEIAAIEYFLPENVSTTADLDTEFPEWSMEKISVKTGIQQRHIATTDQCASDLAFCAGERLFASGACNRDEIDFIVLCTQTPDYFLPSTACTLQRRLALPTSVGALDINLGCSGFVYGLGVVRGLIETGQAERVILFTADTYSKLILPSDRNVRALFGDAGAATLITRTTSGDVGPFVYGTDGRGAENLMVRGGAFRTTHSMQSAHLFMNGQAILVFTIQTIPLAIDRLLAKAQRTVDQIDLFVFHQASRYILELLRNKLKIPEEKFVIDLEHCGNTVSSTIPIALKNAAKMGRLKGGETVMILGFGVGYSWGGALLVWSPGFLSPRAENSPSQLPVRD